MRTAALGFLAAALALLAAFSASLRTTCSTRIGNERRCWMLTKRQGEEGQPGHRLAIQTGKEPIQAMGVLAGFGDDDFIAHQQVDLLGPVHMVPKEHPKQRGPREHRGEKALDGPITAAFARPAGDAQHRDASRHHQQSAHYPAELAQGGCRYSRVGGIAKVLQCPLWASCRVRVEVSGRQQLYSTYRSPCKLANFGEGIDDGLLSVYF